MNAPLTRGMHPDQRALLAALADDQVGPMTRREIQDFLGIATHTAQRRIQRMRARGLLRIVRWARTEGAQAAVYGPADGQRDAPPLPKLTSQERSDRWNKTHKVERSIRRYGNRSAYANPFAGLLRPAQE